MTESSEDLLKFIFNMSDKILYLDHYSKKIREENLTTENINCARMLEEIAKSNPKNAFVVVWPEDGSEPSYHSSTGDMPTVLMRLNGFIHAFYNGEFNS